MKSVICNGCGWAHEFGLRPSFDSTLPSWLQRPFTSGATCCPVCYSVDYRIVKDRAKKLFSRLATHALVIKETKKLGGTPIVYPCISSDSINALWRRYDRDFNRGCAAGIRMKNGLRVFVGIRLKGGAK